MDDHLEYRLEREDMSWGNNSSNESEHVGRGPLMEIGGEIPGGLGPEVIATLTSEAGLALARRLGRADPNDSFFIDLKNVPRS